MQKIAIIQISEAGSEIAATLKRELKATVIQRSEVGKEWKKQDAFIFIGAMGICVRTIAPFVNDKHEDPAVVCVDSLGTNAISVLSGHIGGANDLTKEISAIPYPLLSVGSLWLSVPFAALRQFHCLPH